MEKNRWAFAPRMAAQPDLCVQNENGKLRLGRPQVSRPVTLSPSSGHSCWSKSRLIEQMRNGRAQTRRAWRHDVNVSSLFYVIVIRVPRSAAAPHIIKNLSHLCSRNNAFGMIQVTSGSVIARRISSAISDCRRQPSLAISKACRLRPPRKSKYGRRDQRVA